MNDENNVSCNDYASMTDTWRRQLCQAGWEPTWGTDEHGHYQTMYRDGEGGESLSLYDAWLQATGNPADFHRAEHDKTFEGGGDN